MNRQGLYQGAITLALAGFLTKLIGALYRIPLARLIGAEGMGLYQMAYPVYTILLALSAAGMPVAMSILISEKNAQGDHGGIRRIFYLALGLMGILGLFFSLLVYQTAGFAANTILQEPRAYYAIVAISPAVFLSSLASVYRGYFQGFQEMRPTAYSQVIEQLIRVITVLVLVYYLLPLGLEMAAAGAAFGTVTGGLVSLLFLIKVLRHFKKRGFFYQNGTIPGEGYISLGARLGLIAFPLSLGGIVLPLMQIVDATIVPLRLQTIGYTVSQATEQFGQLSGMATTLIHLPAIVTIALSTSLVPAINEATFTGNDLLVKLRIRTVMRGTYLLMLPAAVGMWALATPISILLYDLGEVGKTLAMLAPGVLFFGLFQVSAGAIQGLGKTYLPTVNLLVGVVVKTLLSYWLVTWPFLGIRGAALATVIGFLIAFLLNQNVLRKYKYLEYPWKDIPFIRLILAAISLWFVVYWVYIGLEPLFGNNIATLMIVPIGALVYGSVLLISGAVEKSDLEYLPTGKLNNKLINLLEKMHLLR